jgi:hypothetical protein
MGWGEVRIKHLEPKKHSNQLSGQRTNKNRVCLEGRDNEDKPHVVAWDPATGSPNGNT